MTTSVEHEVPQWEKAAPQDREHLARVVADVETFERGIGRDFKERCERFYRQYRGFRKMRDAWTALSPNDRDGMVYEAKRDWGAHLHIPLSYATIERQVPRAVAHRPRMLYLPRHPRWEDNVGPVRLLIDSQQEQIDIDLAFQSVMRAGSIYGLGIGKSFWRREYADRRRVKRRTLQLPGRSEFVVGRLERTCVFDDPDFEDVDVFDFFWDPYGSDMRTCGWVAHRQWLGLDACLDRVARGAWNTASAKELDEKALRGMGSGQKYDEIWQERMDASGFGTFNQSTRGEQVHEVFEWHDGTQVFTVLDRQVLVQAAENPCVGHMPFGVFRPTPLQKQMVGIGALEPIEHLQRELDTRRSQSLDAATLALCAGFAYDEGMVEEEDLVFGPASAIRVSNGRPQDALMPLKTPDLPASAIQQESIIRSDIDAVTGMQDALDNQPGGAVGTATEAQLVQASLSKRIELMSRRFEIEIVRRAARAFLYLNQRMITENRSPMRQPDGGQTFESAAHEGRWKWFEIGPGELQGEYEIIPEGGSMAAENVPQMRQDGMQIMQMFGQHPNVDPKQPLMASLRKFGIKDPEAWLRQQDAPVPPMVFEILQKQLGVDPRLIQTAIQTAQAQDPQLAPEQQGPSTEQVGQMMGVAA